MNVVYKKVLFFRNFMYIIYFLRLSYSDDLDLGLSTLNCQLYEQTIHLPSFWYLSTFVNDILFHDSIKHF